MLDGRKFLAWTQGKKTYAAVAVGLALGAANAAGYHEPPWVDWILAAFGLGALRAAVTSQTSQTAIDMITLVRTILENVTEPAQSAPVPQSVRLPSGKVVTLGRRSNVEPAEETAETRALNKEQFDNA